MRPVATPRAARRREPVQPRAKEKVERVLGAARVLLATEGPAAFNTNRLAAQAGIGVGSLYEYFPDKRAIAARLVEELSAEETSAILARFAEVEALPLATAIQELVATVFALYRKHHALYRALWAVAPGPREVGHRPGEKLVLRHIRARLAPIAGELGIADPELAAFTVFHLVESLCAALAAEGVRRFGVAAREAQIRCATLRYLGLTEPLTGPPPARGTRARGATGRAGNAVVNRPSPL